VVEHPRRQPDRRIRQGEADRLRVLGHLDDVAPLEDGRHRFERLAFLVLCVLGEEGHRKALEESVRGAGAEDRR
jgi:hypothetical protein